MLTSVRGCVVTGIGGGITRSDTYLGTQAGSKAPVAAARDMISLWERGFGFLPFFPAISACFRLLLPLLLLLRAAAAYCALQRAITKTQNSSLWHLLPLARMVAAAACCEKC
jgi:hypothetical protein